MGIKDKLKRTSKIFSSDSKENLSAPEAKEAVTKDAADIKDEVVDKAEEGKKTVEDKVDEILPSKEAETVEEPAKEAETAEEPAKEAEAAEEPAKEAETAEPVKEAETAEPVKEAEAEAESPIDTVKEKGEDAKAAIKQDAEKVQKAGKKNDIFKKLLSKFKKPSSSTSAAK